MSYFISELKDYKERRKFNEAMEKWQRKNEQFEKENKTSQ